MKRPLPLVCISCCR